MFAYCLNNPVGLHDFRGNEAVSSIIGSVLGAAAAGALIGFTSYAVSCGLNGDKMTWDGAFGAVGIGALNGALGAVAGMFKGVRLALSVTTGITAGVYTAANTDGDMLEKVAQGVSVGIIAGCTTYAGASIDTSGFGPLGSAFANFSTTLFVGVPGEIMAVGSQQRLGIKKSINRELFLSYYLKIPGRVNRISITSGSSNDKTSNYLFC